MASTGATHRHLQLLVLLLICASTSTTAAPIKLLFELPDDSEWHPILGMPAGKEAAILFCKEAVEAYNRENPKRRFNGCRSVHSAKAMLIPGQRLALRLLLESSQRSWRWTDVDLAADILVTISFVRRDGRLDSWVDSVVVLRVLRDHGL